MADRGVSTVVSYVMVLGIIAILMTTLVSAFAPFVINQQQSTAQSSLEVFGNDLASDIETVDRLVLKAGENGTISLRTRLPDRVGGSRYEIEIEQRGASTATYTIRLRTVSLETGGIVHFRTETPVEEQMGTRALDGGILRITYDKDADKLVIQNV